MTTPALEPAAAPPLPAGLPDHWCFDRDLNCPACRYNLRMLRTPRCPECGGEFRWQAILHVSCPRCGENLARVDGGHCPRCRLALDWSRLLSDAPAVGRHLYEKSERPLWAAMRTVFAVLLPRRFWRRMPLEASPNLPRLARYRRVVATVGIVLLVAYPIAFFAGLTRWWWPTWNWDGLGLPFRWLAVLGLFVAAPPLVARVLPRFTPTLARFQIRRDQLTRCFTYAWTFTCWARLSVLATSAYFVIWSLASGGTAIGILRVVPLSPFGSLYSIVTGPRFWWNRRIPFGGIATYGYFAFDLLLLIFALGYWYFLYVALRKYLRLDRINAVALVVSTLAIVALLIPTALTLLAFAWLVTREGL